MGKYDYKHRGLKKVSTAIRILIEMVILAYTFKVTHWIVVVQFVFLTLYVEITEIRIRQLDVITHNLIHMKKDKYDSRTSEQVLKDEFSKSGLPK